MWTNAHWRFIDKASDRGQPGIWIYLTCFIAVTRPPEPKVSCGGCCHWTITLARLSKVNLGKPDTMRRTEWEIFFHFISRWPFRATATNGLYQAWRGELHGITKVCTDPSVRHYKGVHWSKGAILQECAQIQVCAPILLKSGYQYAVH